VEQADVLDGDDSLVGEGFEQLDLCRGERTDFGAPCGQRSNNFSLLTQGNQQVGTRRAEDTQHWKIILRLSVRDMQRAMLNYPAKSWFINTDPFVGKTYGYRTEPRPRNEIVPVAKSQPQIIDSTNPSRALHDGVEDRLHVRGGAADDTEDL